MRVAIASALAVTVAAAPPSKAARASTAADKCAFRPAIVVIFVRVTKTWGSSFDAMLETVGFDTHTAHDEKQAVNLLAKLERRCSLGKHDGLIAVRLVGFMNIAENIEATRTALRRRGVPVVTMASLQNPLDYAVSVYNHVCGGGSDDNTACPREHSARALVDWVSPNLQCSYLYMVWTGGGKQNGTAYPTPEQCLYAYGKLRMGMDHVADGARINDTLAFIERAMQGSDDNFSDVASRIRNIERNLATMFHGKERAVSRGDFTDEDEVALSASQAGDWAMYRFFRNPCGTLGEFLEDSASLPYSYVVGEAQIAACDDAIQDAHRAAVNQSRGSS